MWYTRSRRYANHSSWQKYEKNPQDANNSSEESKLRKKILPLNEDFLDNEKAQSARIFYEKWKLAESNKQYTEWKRTWKQKYG